MRRENKRAMSATMVAELMRRIECEEYYAAGYYARQCQAAVPLSSAYQSWYVSLGTLADFLDNAAIGVFKPIQSIFSEKGNSKLPFLAFSALSGKGFCPGAGDCLNFCYTSYRYPQSLNTMVQNTVLLSHREGRVIIDIELNRIIAKKNGKSVVLRLYVDGDFQSAEIAAFWFETIKQHETLEAYGYSKSLLELIELDDSGYDFPENYLLNISVGHCHSDSVVERAKQLSIYRGEFIAVGKKGKKVYGTKAYAEAARAAFKSENPTDDRKVFVCPGQCGSCTPRGHACGSKRFSDIPVVILTH